ncbi:globin family protein [Rhizobium sp. FKL33]|uniref:globin family protein n=1 Tax=Rhizobium sp. FKL33 TaxID=2562307 RepID=UPI0010BFF077|nr:globin family protein [Rhizobium sp. FKL33]
MQPAELLLLKSSFAKVAPIRDLAAELFYARLFELDPGLKPLFAHSDMASQGKKLMTALAAVVAGLERPEQLLPKIEVLAVRHLDYGVRKEHYDTVGRALIDTLANGLGDEFTPETQAAWIVAYSLLSSVMIKAAYPSSAAA